MQDTLDHVWGAKQLVPLTCGYGPYTLQVRAGVRRQGCVGSDPEQVDTTGHYLLVSNGKSDPEVARTQTTSAISATGIKLPEE
jgi:hypothetical protein